MIFARNWWPAYLIALAAVLPLSGCSSLLFADPAATGDKPADAAGENEGGEDAVPWNLDWKTRGGNQVWSDVLVYSSWRIQHNVVLDHYRLIDPKDVRRAWGTLEQCQKKFDELKVEEKIPAPSGKAVVVVHGLWRSRQSMQPLCDCLAKDGNYHVVNVSYASTRATIGDHAAGLAKVVAGLGGVEELSFVGCSLGNLVIRRYLADQTAGGKALDRRVKRVVMLAPPNQGAQIAKRFAADPVVQAAWGMPGQEIADWDTLAKTLATPPCEFGIIAGGKGEPGRNPLIPGDDDYLLSVDETRLDGATDFLVLPVTHTSIKRDAKVHECTLRFLQKGKFAAP